MIINPYSFAGVSGPPFGGNAGLLTGLVDFWPLSETGPGTRVGVHAGLNLTDVNNNVLSAAGLGGTTAADIPESTVYQLSRNNEAAIQTGDIDYQLGIWVYPRDAADVNCIIAKDNAGSGREFNLFLWGGTLHWYVFNGVSTARGVATQAAPSLNNWHWITCWHSATSNQVGLAVDNGTPTVVATSGAAGGNTQPFRVGTDSLNRAVNARLQRCFFYKNRLLDATDRSAHWNSGNGLDY